MNVSTTIATMTLGLKLQPLDVLFFRDGRPFMTGNEYMVSGLPMPQTFAGAIRTALLRAAGCDFPSLGKAIKCGRSFAEAVQDVCSSEYHWIGEARVRGPWLARCQMDDTIDVLVPAPAILHREKKHDENLHRLSPLHVGSLPGWKPLAEQAGLRPLWLRHLNATEPVEGYLTSRGLALFLRGGVPAPDDVIPASHLYAIDRRTGIGIAPDRLVAEDSQIFGRGFLSLNDGVCLYGEVVLPETVTDHSIIGEDRLLPLGGEGRNVLVERLTSPHVWPSSQPEGGKQKPLVLLATPCPFQAGWKPATLADHMVAAAVPGSVAFSGWDLARGGPKPTRFAVPAGSTYFLESMPGDWPPSLAESDDEQRQGWGCYLKGVWTDE